MATISARGYVNRVETKTAASGKTFTKFDLAVKQKRKAKEGEKDGPGLKIENGQAIEKLYLKCVDFSGTGPEEGSYLGVTGYLTVTGWYKDGRGGANLDVTVTSYEMVEPREGAPVKKKASAPATDPFHLGQDEGIPF